MAPRTSTYLLIALAAMMLAPNAATGRVLRDTGGALHPTPAGVAAARTGAHAKGPHALLGAGDGVWAGPVVATGNRMGWESGATSQQQGAMASIDARVADLDSRTDSAAGRALLGDWAHENLAHGKNMAFNTDGPTSQQETTMSDIEALQASMASKAAGSDTP